MVANRRLLWGHSWRMKSPTHCRYQHAAGLLNAPQCQQFYSSCLLCTARFVVTPHRHTRNSTFHNTGDHFKTLLGIKCQRTTSNLQWVPSSMQMICWSVSTSSKVPIVWHNCINNLLILLRGFWLWPCFRIGFLPCWWSSNDEWRGVPWQAPWAINCFVWRCYPRTGMGWSGFRRTPRGVPGVSMRPGM